MLQEIEIQRNALTNGAVLLANLNNSTRSVTFLGSVRAGAMNDEKGKFGTAELVSRLLDRGTDRMSSSEVSRCIEEIGATLQFSNNDETVSFSGRCHTENLRRVLEILSDCLSKPSFQPDEVEKVRAEVIADLEEEKDQTRTGAYRGLVSLIYGKDNPYGRNSLGTIEDIVTVTREEIVSFHERYYKTGSLILSVTGSFEHQRLVSDVEDELGKCSGEPSPGNLQSPRYSTGIHKQTGSVVSMPHKSQVDLAMGARAVSRSSPDYYSLNLGNLILGRIGLYGRLGKNVREEKGVAYYCYSALQSKSYSGHIGIYAGVNPKNLESAINGIAEEVEKISEEPLSHEELSKGRRNLKGSLAVALESPFERASIIHDIEYYRLGLDYFARYPSILDQVTSESVLSSFEEFFKLEKLHIVAAGPIVPDFPLHLAKKQAQ